MECLGLALAGHAAPSFPMFSRSERVAVYLAQMDALWQVDARVGFSLLALALLGQVLLRIKSGVMPYGNSS